MSERKREPTDDLPTSIPPDPENIGWLQCVSCKERVRPILRPLETAGETVSGRPRTREELREEDVRAGFVCPECGTQMDSEMGAFEKHVFGEYRSQEVEIYVSGEWLYDIQRPEDAEKSEVPGLRELRATREAANETEEADSQQDESEDGSPAPAGT